MIPLIQQALVAGYTAAQILTFIGNKISGMSTGIKTAKTRGYSDEDILKFLQGKIKTKNPKEIEKGATDLENYYSKIGLKTKEEKQQDKARYIKGALGLAGTALGAYKLYQNYSGQFGNMLSGLGQGQQPTVPQPPQLPGGTQAALPAPMAGAPAQPTPPVGVTPPQPQPSPAIGQQVQAQAQAPVQAAMQPVTPQQTVTPAAPTVKASELLQTTGKLQSIDNLLAAGNDPGTIAKALGGLAPKKILQDIETQAGKPLEQVVADYAAETQPQKQQIAPIEEMEKAPIEETTLEPQKIKASKEITKGEGVVTESGEIGTVKGISGNNFLVEDDSGKISQVPMDKLRAQPEAIKKAKIVFDPSEIPEDERSAALAISLPMPDRSAIINMFHDGSFYIYKRKDGKAIDEDVVRRIIDGTDHPISTGDTFMGLWNPGKGDSRGSASYKELTSMAQKMGDPDDPNKPLTFEKITDSFVHGYHKKFINLLREATKLYGAKPKKEKKKAK